MDYTLILLILPLGGAIAGFLAGLLGIGGGILLVPLFLWCFQLAHVSSAVLVQTAFATSLSVIIPTTINSTLGHWRRGHIVPPQVLAMAGGGVAGALVGAAGAAQLDGSVLRQAFGCMQLAVAIYLFYRPQKKRPTSLHQQSQVSPWALLGIGLVAGAFSAFFGVGGGVVAVPLLVLVLRLPMRQAVGNSSALIVVSSSTAVIVYICHGWQLSTLPPWSLGYVNVLATLLTAPFSIACVPLGVRLASRLSHERLLRVFAVLLFIVGLKMAL